LINELVEEAAKAHEVSVLTGLRNYPKGDLYPGFSLDKGPYREVYRGVAILSSPAGIDCINNHEYSRPQPICPLLNRFLGLYE